MSVYFGPCQLFPDVSLKSSLPAFKPIPSYLYSRHAFIYLWLTLPLPSVHVKSATLILLFFNHWRLKSLDFFQSFQIESDFLDICWHFCSADNCFQLARLHFTQRKMVSKPGCSTAAAEKEHFTPLSYSNPVLTGTLALILMLFCLCVTTQQDPRAPQSSLKCWEPGVNTKCSI